MGPCPCTGTNAPAVRGLNNPCAVTNAARSYKWTWPAAWRNWGWIADLYRMIWKPF